MNHRYCRLQLGVCFLLVLSLIFVSVAALRPSVSAATTPRVDEEIRLIVADQNRAVNEGNWEQFRKHLWMNAESYVQERKQWFQDAQAFMDPGTFDMEVESITPHKPGQLLVQVRQSYQKNGVRHIVRLPLLYQQTEHGWKDADLLFQTVTTDHVTVKFADEDLSEQANVAINTAEKAIEAFSERLNWNPKKPILIKLYAEKEVFRQSIKLSLPQWVIGWNEPGQSIKFIGDSKPDELFAAGIVHELTHQVLSDLSNDNAAYWLQEGVAEYYQRHLLPGLNVQESMTLQKPRWTLEQMERLNLESLRGAEVQSYYLHAYDIVRFFMKRFGETEFRQWCAALKMHPNKDVDPSEKRAQLNVRTREAFEKATHYAIDDFAKEWFHRDENAK